MPVSEDDVLKILVFAKPKTCDLDLIPNPLAKKYAHMLKTPINNVINYSFKEDSFPICFYMAYITLLLQKPNMDKNVLKKYRPVSNLCFISKLIEKGLTKQ